MLSRLAFHSLRVRFPLTNSSYRSLVSSSAPRWPRLVPAMAAASASRPLTSPPSPSSEHGLTFRTW